MNMLFEHTKCKNCKHINPAYKNICTECKSYLRERVVNIDLWSTIQLIIENPELAFKQIIFAEHKNFVSFITFFIAIKNLLIARFLSVPELGSDGVSTSFIVSLFLMILVILILSSLFIFVQNVVYIQRDIKLRIKDIYSVSVYSFIPYLFGLVFVFPVELVVLGGDIFSNNPYSFQIKPLFTYMLIGVEFITIIWSFYLIQKSIYSITTKRNISVKITALYFIIWFSTLYLSSKIIFTI